MGSRMVFSDGTVCFLSKIRLVPLPTSSSNSSFRAAQRSPAPE